MQTQSASLGLVWLVLLPACLTEPGGGGFDHGALETPTPQLSTQGENPAIQLEVVDEWDQNSLPPPKPGDELIGLAGPGVTLIDLDGDRYLDGVYAIPVGHSLILRNNQAGLLEPWAGAGVDGKALPAAQAVAGADVDGDGDGDLFLGGGTGKNDWILINEGQGQFSRQTLKNSEGNTHTGSFIDVDGDGDLDLFVARSVAVVDIEGIEAGEVVGTGNDLYINDGSGHFEAQSQRLPTEILAAISFQGMPLDADGDGDQDLYLINDFGMLAMPNQLLLNDGTGHFTLAEACGCNLAAFAMGGSSADANGDGFPDLYSTDLGGPTLLLNAGDGSFYDATLRQGADIPASDEQLASWGTAFSDLNQDSWPDLLVVFGQLLLAEDENDQATLDSYAGDSGGDWVDSPAQRDALLQNQGDGYFRDGSSTATFVDDAVGRAVAVGDLNRDGLPDVITAGVPYVKVWINRSKAPAGITVEFDTSQYQPVGSSLELTVDGVVHRHWLQPSSTYSASAPEYYLGLGKKTKAQSLRITFPNGKTREFKDIKAGTRLWVD